MVTPESGSASGRTRRPRASAASRSSTPPAAEAAPARAAVQPAAQPPTTTEVVPVPGQPSADSLSQGGCGDQPPGWGVTRQFDFGQFVTLYHQDTDGGSDYVVPLVVYPDGHLSVVQDPPPPGVAVPAGGVAVPITAADAAGGADSVVGSSAPTLLDAAGGLPLQLALTTNDPLHALSTQADAVDVDDLAPLLGDTPSLPGTPRVPVIGPAAKEALLNGRAVTVLRYDPTDAKDVDAVTITPTAHQIELGDDQVDAALATGLVELPDGNHLALPQDGSTLDNLRTGGMLRAAVRGDDHAIHVYELSVGLLSSSAPLASEFQMTDPTDLLIRRVLPAVDGSALPVSLSAENLAELRTQATTSVPVNGTPVRLTIGTSSDAVSTFDPSRPTLLSVPTMSTTAAVAAATSNVARPLSATPTTDSATPNALRVNGGGVPVDTAAASFYGRRTLSTGDLTRPRWTQPAAAPVQLGPAYRAWADASLAAQAQPAGSGSGSPVANSPSGLQVAVFLPWRQTWTFLGLSRGALLSSLALAPQEQRRVRTFSWERQTRTLEQSSETDTSLEQDFTSTTRDTEDVFREMTASQHFTSQLHADVNASYSTGVASINASVGGNLSNESGLQQVARSTTQHMTETVHRASAQVRSQRITRVTEAESSVSGNETVSTIRNANESFTLTFNYFEQLAHYRIDTIFRREQVRVVAMVPNPLGSTAFSNLTVRTNEAVLQQALLNPELSDAFAAARLLSSYDFAWIEAQRIDQEAKIQAELDRERTVPPANASPPQSTHPTNPYNDPVVAAVNDVNQAAKPLLAGQIDPALNDIGHHNNPSADELTSARHWLWVALAQAKAGGGAISALQKLTAVTTTLTIDDARRVLDGFPSSVLGQLGTLSQLPDTEKESSALSGAIHRYMKAAWDWGWWTDACHSNGLYNPDDNGVGGAIQRLSDTLGQYDAKASEGDAVLAGQDMVNQGEQDQDEETWVDKLEMKYGLDVVADASERQEALLAHLSAHADYYRFVLFQALPPGEQLSLLTQLAPQLQIGFFEPRVVAYSGSSLAVPLTPTGENELAQFVGQLAQTLGDAADAAQAAADAMYPDDVILPTPGLVVETSMGTCVASEPARVQRRQAENDLAASHAAAMQAEVARRQARLQADPPLLDAFVADPTERVEILDASTRRLTGDHDGR